jgi:hypothetical protein
MVSPELPAGDASWTDYAVEARVKLGDGSHSGTGLLFRVADQNNLYSWLTNVAKQGCTG